MNVMRLSLPSHDPDSEAHRGAVPSGVGPGRPSALPPLQSGTMPGPLTRGFRAGVGLLLGALLTTPVLAEDPVSPTAPGTQSAPKIPASPDQISRPYRVSRPDDRLLLASLSVFRAGPVGMESQNRLVWQHRLFATEDPAYLLNHVEAGLGFKFNPAYYKIGPVVEVQPLSIFGVRAGVEYAHYAGTFGFVQSYDSPEAAYDDQTRAEEATTRAQPAEGAHLFIEPSLQYKFGSTAIRSKWSLDHYRLNIGDADENGVADAVFYDAPLDTLVANGGWVISNETTLITVRGKLALGLQYNAVHPLYNAASFGGELPAVMPQTGHRRLGPLIAWSFNRREFGGFNRPTVLLLLGHYFEHPYRTAWSKPYVLFGFGFGLDFLRPSK